MKDVRTIATSEVAMAIVTCAKCGAKNNVDPARAADGAARCGRCHAPLPAPAPGTETGASAGAGGAGHPVEITDQSFAGVLAQAGDKPVLVDCWATWCPPCRMLAPTIDQIAGESNGRWVIAKMDTDQNPQTSARFNITSIPTLLIFRRGQLVDQLVGLQPKQNIIAKLNGASA
jgi:thioredoxin